MKWISVKDELPPLSEDICCVKGILAYHTVHGVGFANFFKAEEWMIEELEAELPGSKYICSADFILNYWDGNCFPHQEDEIDIFDDSPHFLNLGTITHWMQLPKPPERDESSSS